MHLAGVELGDEERTCGWQSFLCKELYDTAGIASMIGNVLDGFHATIFAYGQTGSGKTFTMEGYEYEKQQARGDRVQAKPKVDVSSDRLGIVPRVILELFQAIAAASVDKILDLLNPATSLTRVKPLRLRWAANEEFYVENLVLHACSSADEMLGRFHDGVKQKIMATHNLNAASSRSHCIYTLYVESVDPANPDDVTKAKLSLVDLAGSERVVKTGATGVTLQESIGINKSLFVLRQVIQTLSDDGSTGSAATSHVPYRDSKLTALLKHSLGGNSITLMVACLSPCDAFTEENLSTLVYAARAQSISNKPVKNEDPKTLLIQKLRDEVANLKEQLAQAQLVILRLTGDESVPETTATTATTTTPTTTAIEPLPPERYEEDVLAPRKAVPTPQKSQVPRGIPNNQVETPSTPPEGRAPVVVVDTTDKKKLKMNVIDNVELIKNMVKNERQLWSQIESVGAETNKLKMENRTLNLENQSLREKIEVLEYLVVKDDDGGEFVPAPPQERIDQVLNSRVKPSRSQGSLRPHSTADKPSATLEPEKKKRETGMLSISELRHLLHKKGNDEGAKKQRSSAKVSPTALQPPPHPVAALLTTLESNNNNSALEQDSLQSLSELNRLLKVKAAMKHGSISR
ncbi:unnamed protein product [Aphanomyces euteiches]